MTDLELVTTWIDGYVKAWNSNRAADITTLFTEDATYHPAPFGNPWHGQAEIAREWLLHGDAPGETTFTWQPVAIEDGLAVVRGITVYPGRTFSNLWLIRLTADGRCREFTEWWMEHPVETPARRS